MKNTARKIVLASSLLVGMTIGLAGTANAQVTNASIQADASKVPNFNQINKTQVMKFYADRANAPVWTSAAGLTPAAQELHQAILSVLPEHGLRPTDYLRPQIEAYFAAGGVTAANAEQAEFALTEAFLDASFSLSIGRFEPGTMGDDMKYKRNAFTRWDVLKNITTNGGIAAGFEQIAPQHAAYKGLSKSLIRLRALKAAGGFGPLVAQKKLTLKLGSKNPTVQQVKTRLQQLGYPIVAVDQNFDEQLESIVKEIQDNNMLPSNGAIAGGSKVYNYLSVSLDARIQQVELAMEKYRWLPAQLESRYIFVNLSNQHLTVTDPAIDLAKAKQAQGGFLTDQEQELLTVSSMRTINGRPERKTPSMRDETQYVLLNPKWIVPPTVFAEDKVTMIQGLLATQGAFGVSQWFTDHHFYITTQDFKTVLSPDSINWNLLDPKTEKITRTAKFYIVQQPNYDNALGVVKIMLGNPWSIYMHDTNERDKFPNAQRDLSSGCIRLEKPIDMATYLLAGTQWTKPSIEAFVALPGETKDKETHASIPQANKITLYTMDLNAIANDQGAITFTQDIYNHAAAMTTSLKKAGYLK